MFVTLLHLVLPSTCGRNHPPIHQQLTLSVQYVHDSCFSPTVRDLLTTFSVLRCRQWFADTSEHTVLQLPRRLPHPSRLHRQVRTRLLARPRWQRFRSASSTTSGRPTGCRQICPQERSRGTLAGSSDVRSSVARCYLHGPRATQKHHLPL